MGEAAAAGLLTERALPEHLSVPEHLDGRVVSREPYHWIVADPEVGMGLAQVIQAPAPVVVALHDHRDDLGIEDRDFGRHSQTFQPPQAAGGGGGGREVVGERAAGAGPPTPTSASARSVTFSSTTAKISGAIRWQ
jgi:hypothetical protein